MVLRYPVVTDGTDLKYDDSTGEQKLGGGGDAASVTFADANDYYNSSDVEGALEEVGETSQKTGYDRLRPTTMPALAYDQGTRTVSVSVPSGESEFSFYTDWKKVTKTTTQTVVIPDTTAFYYIYFDSSAVLQYVEWSATPDAAFYELCITAGVRWNATQGTGGLQDERHGLEMSSTTHKMEHDTYGARYANGLDIEGLSDGSNVYTQTTYGEFWDEDIQHKCAVSATHGWMYRLGADGDWTTRAADSDIAVDDGGSYHVWNEWTGTTWQLTEGGSQTDYWITFFMAQPKYGGGVISKIMGQNAYSSKSNARDAIESELQKMKLDGLPGPETVFLYAVIVNRNGNLILDADGNEFYDLRSVKGGASAGSTAASTAQDIGTDVTNFDGNLSATDTNVQLALDTIDDMSAGAPGGTTTTGTVIEDVIKNDVIAVYQINEAPMMISMDSIVNLGEGTGGDVMDKIAGSYIFDGTATTSIDLFCAKIGTPVDNLICRIETIDQYGTPTGTLVDPNAESTIAGSTLTTGGMGMLNTVATFTFTSFNYTGIASIIISRSDTADSPDYYEIGLFNAWVENCKIPMISYFHIRDYNYWNDSGDNETIAIKYSTSNIGAYSSGLVKNRSGDNPSVIGGFSMNKFLGFANANYNKDEVATIQVDGLLTGFSGLIVNNSYSFYMYGNIYPAFGFDNFSNMLAISETEIYLTR